MTQMGQNRKPAMAKTSPLQRLGSCKGENSLQVNRARLSRRLKAKVVVEI